MSISLLALKKLRNSADIEDDIMEMRAEEQAQMAESKITLYQLVTSPTLKFPLLIAVIMQLSQQLSGKQNLQRRPATVTIFYTRGHTYATK